MTWPPRERSSPRDRPAELRDRHRFGALVQPHVGLIDGVRHLPSEVGEPDVEIVTATLGNVSAAVPSARDATSVGGAGADLDPELAWIRATVEAAERYASIVHDERDFVVATARELASDALRLDDIPLCSPAEYADPRCPLVPPRDDVPIRWVRGFSLVDRRERLVPATMTHLHLDPWPAERFWLQISTGVAAHTTLHAALVAALCEDVERDAVALTWLGSVPLPSIERPAQPSAAVALLDRFDRARLGHHELDATTDLGIPTVLSIQVAPGHPYCAVTVSCATALTPEEAYAKALREACPVRLIMNKPHEIPAEVVDFHHLIHGAHYYGRGHHGGDFEFLLSGAGGTTSLAAMSARTVEVPDGADDERLAALVERLRRLGMDAIAVDLTTDELRDVGLWVVRVVVPRLMPISFVHRARYLGTARLYDYVGRVRRRTFSEADVNPAPLPFA